MAGVGVAAMRPTAISGLRTRSGFLIPGSTAWALDSHYPGTAAGLAACYHAALPFFVAMRAGPTCSIRRLPVYGLPKGWVGAAGGSAPEGSRFLELVA